MTRAAATQITTPQKGFVVEFIGLPGVGKTTLALEVLAHLTSAHLTPALPVTLAYTLIRGKPWFVRRFYSTRSILGLARTQPRYALHTGQVIRASGQRSFYDTLKVTNNWLSVSAATVQAQGAPGIWLFDQGMFQALWSVGYSAGAKDRSGCLQTLSAQMPKPDLLVLLRAELLAVLRRLQTRGGKASRLDTGVEANAEARLFEAEALLDQLAGLSRTAAVRVLELDATCDDALGSNARHVADTIRAALYPGQGVSGEV